MSMKYIANGFLLIFFGLAALSASFIESIYITAWAVLALGLNFLVDGLLDKSKENYESVNKKIGDLEVQIYKIMNSSIGSEIREQSRLYDTREIEAIDSQEGDETNALIEDMNESFVEFSNVCERLLMKMNPVAREKFDSHEIKMLIRKGIRDPLSLSDISRRRFVIAVNKHLQNLSQADIDEFSDSDDFELFNAIYGFYAL